MIVYPCISWGFKKMILLLLLELRVLFKTQPTYFKIYSKLTKPLFES